MRLGGQDGPNNQRGLSLKSYQDFLDHNPGFERDQDTGLRTFTSSKKMSTSSRRATTSKTGRNVSTRARAAPRGKKWSVSGNVGGYGMNAGFKASSKRATGITRAVAPSSTSTTVSQYKPKVSGGSASNSFTIENRELLSSCIWQGTPGFELTEFSINPGLSSIFQYASNSSKNYTRYAMNMRLVWAPSVPSSVQGQVAFAMDRDNTSTSPSSMQEVLSYESNIVTSLWKNINFPSTGMFASSEKLLYLRYGPLDDFSQINLYDLMKVYIILNGVSGVSLETAQSLGSVYIEYKITFFNQKLQDIVESNIFSVSPDNVTFVSLADDNLTANYPYGYGDGDVQILSTGDSSYMVFPTAGYYSIDFVETIGVVSGSTIGAVWATQTVPNISEIGAEIDVGDPTLDPVSTELAFCGVGVPTVPNGAQISGHNKFIIRVLASGSYMGESAPVGEGYILIGPESVLTTMRASANIGTAVLACIQSYIAVNRISLAEAAFYYPVVFPPVAASPMALNTHRRKFHPVKGHARHRIHDNSKKIKQILQETVQCTDITSRDIVKEENSDYEMFLKWKKTVC